MWYSGLAIIEGLAALVVTFNQSNRSTLREAALEPKGFFCRLLIELGGSISA